MVSSFARYFYFSKVLFSHKIWLILCTMCAKILGGGVEMNNTGNSGGEGLSSPYLPYNNQSLGVNNGGSGYLSQEYQNYYSNPMGISGSVPPVGKRKLRSRDISSAIVDILISILFLIIFLSVCYVAILVIRSNSSVF